MGFLKRLLNFFASGSEPRPSRTPGRNDPCWCGSGLKYKRCHLEEDEKKRSGSFTTSCGPT